MVDDRAFLSALVAIFRLGFGEVSTCQAFGPRYSLYFGAGVGRSSVSATKAVRFRGYFLCFYFSARAVAPCSGIYSCGVSYVTPVFGYFVALFRDALR